MKTKLIAFASSIALATITNGAVSLSGTALKNVQSSTQVDLASGTLGLLVVDTAGDGFINGLVTTGNPISPFTIDALGVSTTVGQTFGGDLIIARLSSSVSFGDTILSGAAAGLDASTYLSKNFAIIWFNSLTSAGSETTASGNFGIARGADWTMPAANSGTFSFGTTASSLDQLTLGSTTTAASGQGVAFATNGATLSIVPEPSAALLGAIGALGLLRRRRN